MRTNVNQFQFGFLIMYRDTNVSVLQLKSQNAYMHTMCVNSTPLLFPSAAHIWVDVSHCDDR